MHTLLGTRPTRWLFAALAGALLLPFAKLCARQPQQPSQQESSSNPQESSSKKTDPDAPEPYKPQPKKLPPAGTAPPVFDPLRAEKDIEVGRYYLRRGDLDAAIDRFQDATQARPGYALPFLLLGEAQEKKARKTEAIKSYTKYLEMLPHADDARKIRKRIEKLQAELDKARRKSG